MRRKFESIIVLAALAALAACIEMAPRSSVPFHDAQGRHARYAAEVTLAIKEERRDAATEAAANGRLVLPQMPEIWGITRPATPDLVPAVAALAAPAPPPEPGPRRCDHCPRPLRIAGLATPLMGAGAIEPAAGGMARATPYRFQLHFGFDSADLDAAAERVVKSIAGSALMIRPLRVIVAGYTDRSGDAAYNQRLSQRRAAAVIDALIAAGIPADLIETTALGERAPASWTDDDIAHGDNRRVEITLV